MTIRAQFQSQSFRPGSQLSGSRRSLCGRREVEDMEGERRGSEWNLAN